MQSNSNLKHSTFFQLATIGINGIVDVIDESNPDPMKLQQREKVWFASSPRSRLQYLGPNPGFTSLSEQSSEILSLDPSADPVGSFCLLVLEPEQVDYLNLKSNERITFLSRRVEGDKMRNSERVSP